MFSKAHASLPERNQLSRQFVNEHQLRSCISCCFPLCPETWQFKLFIPKGQVIKLQSNYGDSSSLLTFAISKRTCKFESQVWSSAWPSWSTRWLSNAGNARNASRISWHGLSRRLADEIWSLSQSSPHCNSIFDTLRSAFLCPFTGLCQH